MHGHEMVEQLQQWGRELGFSRIGVSDVDLSSAEPHLQAWLEAGFHGDMSYMARHGMRRARPAQLLPGTVSIITARMDYLPQSHGVDWREQELARTSKPQEAVVSLYARGRDYHKVLRQRLQQLADRLAQEVSPLGVRVFVDSAPVLEVELASRSGLGWRGKHTLLLHQDAGSMFFLGEIFVDCALPPTAPEPGHCGSCAACIPACPTQAIVAPYQVDARRCISYLTIEHAGDIPLEFRTAIGNRIYGCDDCQTACPWNKFAKRSALPDFDVRDGMQGETLQKLFAWLEPEFLERTQGSAIRRIGYQRWQRNLVVALGNQLRHPLTDAKTQVDIRQRLTERRITSSPMVQNHIDWALQTDG